MKPRSELGRLARAIEVYGNEFKYFGNDGSPEHDRRRKNIIERVRKLMQKAERRGKSARRADRENTP